jgi:hypothetical protein
MSGTSSTKRISTDSNPQIQAKILRKENIKILIEKEDGYRGKPEFG